MFRASHNALPNIPSALLQLPSLRVLDLSHNRVRELPPGALTALASLQELRLAKNKLRELKAGAVERLPRLQLLDLDSNELHHLQPRAVSIPQTVLAPETYSMTNVPVSPLSFVVVGSTTHTVTLCSRSTRSLTDAMESTSDTGEAGEVIAKPAHSFEFRLVPAAVRMVGTVGTLPVAATAPAAPR